MLKSLIGAAFTIGMVGTASAQQSIRITSDWGTFTADLAENEASRSLVEMLPLTIEMRDHMRQEKTGNLPSALPEAPRQRAFSKGTLGLWSSGDFVIYYADGNVPSPGIVILGQVNEDVSALDRPGPVSVTLEKID